jgi:outer membrane protein assembly complex protein YaeT
LVNTRKILVILIVILSAFVLQGQEGYVLTKISFTGNNTISSGDLKKNLSLQGRNLVDRILFWKGQPVFTEVYLEEDIKQIMVQYQKAGFLHVAVDAYRESDDKRKQVRVIYKITENDPVIISEILYEVKDGLGVERNAARQLIEGNTKFFSTGVFSRFRDVDIRNTLTEINRLLMENGFPDPSSEYAIDLEEDELKARVIFTVDTGDYCDFGEIIVNGNAKLSEDIIKAEVTFCQGDMYRMSQIQKSQRTIQNLGMFQFVTIKSLLNEITNSNIPIEILVKELPYWSVKTGIGYGLEDRFRLSLNVQKLGFLGGARRADFFAKHSYLEPYHVRLQITQPSFMGSSGSLIIMPFVRREHEPAYDLQRYGISFTIQKNLSINTHAFISYKFERDNLETEITEDYYDLSQQYYNKSSISAGVTRDRSQPQFTPDSGYLVSFLGTLSGLKLNSEYHYIQGLIDIRKYEKLIEGTVLAGRMKAGAMKPIWGDEITPIEERFFAGGSTSIRGWKRGGISPQSSEGIPLGGESYLEMSAEIRQHIWDRFYGVVFLDCGNVWSGYNNHDIAGLKYSAGSGIRVKTPIGPIRFDAAQPLWSRNKQIHLYISIGQAF